MKYFQNLFEKIMLIEVALHKTFQSGNLPNNCPTKVMISLKKQPCAKLYKMLFETWKD